jgi:hypothetical protein
MHNDYLLSTFTPPYHHLPSDKSIIVGKWPNYPTVTFLLRLLSSASLRETLPVLQELSLYPPFPCVK